MRVSAPVEGGANRSHPGEIRRQLAAAVLLEELLEETLEDVLDALAPDFSEDDGDDVSADFSDVDFSPDLPEELEARESLR